MLVQTRISLHWILHVIEPKAKMQVSDKSTAVGNSGPQVSLEKLVDLNTTGNTVQTLIKTLHNDPM